MRVVAPFAKKRGELFRAKTELHLPSLSRSLVAVLVFNPSPPPSLPPSPPPFAYTFSETGGEERGCSVLLCGVRDAALRRGGGKRVEVVDDSLAKFIASLGPVCRRKKRSGAKEAAENVTSGYEDFFVNPGKKRVED